MSGIEIAGLVFGAMGVVPVFKQGYDMILRYRRRRRVRIFKVGDSITSNLANETQNGQVTVSSKYNDYHTAYGQAFAVGDDVARHALKDIVIQLQHGLIVALQATLNGQGLNDPAQLVTLSVSGRLDTLAALSQLAQRLAVAAPISTTLSTAGLGNSSIVSGPPSFKTRRFAKLPTMAVNTKPSGFRVMSTRPQNQAPPSSRTHVRYA